MEVEHVDGQCGWFDGAFSRFLLLFVVYVFIILMCALLQCRQFTSIQIQCTFKKIQYGNCSQKEKKKKENSKYFNIWCFPDLEMYFNSALVL